MGWGIEEAHVYLESVIDFSRSVYSFGEKVEYSAKDIDKTLSTYQKDIHDYANEMKQIADEYDELYRQIKHFKEEISCAVFTLKDRLRSTNEYIEHHATDANGNQTVKREKNPEHERIRSELKRAENRLSQIQSLSYKVYDQAHYMQTVAQNIASKTIDLQRSSDAIHSHLNQIEQMTDLAKNAIHSTEQAIENYISVSI